MLPKRTLLLIGGLFLITGVLLFIALSKNSPVQQSITQKVSTTPPVEKTALLYFNPTTLVATTASSSANSVDIMINADSHKVTAAQFELGFDPRALTNVKVTAPSDFSFFGDKFEYTVLFNEVDNKNGTLNYAIAAALTSQPKSGIGKIATLTFTKISSQPTEIRFLAKTKITEEKSRESILKEATPLTIQ